MRHEIMEISKHSSFWSNKRVLLTGHTGFKGSWLARWLLELDADVTGLSLAPDTNPSLFEILNLKKQLKHNEIDIRDASAVMRIVKESNPEIVFHLAAQPLVRLSYQKPKDTWDINVGGTINLLEAIRQKGDVKACVIITSDKCYENKEQLWGYREADSMGGYDPYSSSKGATELVVASWRHSFFSNPDCCRLASARAGNVIGGGDWSSDRIVVDFVKAVVDNNPLILRNPSATRPWQHVLEPLLGYLTLAKKLFSKDGNKFAEGWNFGPTDDSVITVESLASQLINSWGRGRIGLMYNVQQPHEANLLKLDCSKSRILLNWHGIWDVKTAVQHTVDWYKAFYENSSDVNKLTSNQIEMYMANAKKSGILDF